MLHDQSLSSPKRKRDDTGDGGGAGGGGGGGEGGLDTGRKKKSRRVNVWHPCCLYYHKEGGSFLFKYLPFLFS